MQNWTNLDNLGLQRNLDFGVLGNTAWFTAKPRLWGLVVCVNMFAFVYERMSLYLWREHTRHLFVAGIFQAISECFSVVV